jgi:hypothetical protein
LSPQFKEKGAAYEQVYEIIACIMALSIPHSVGSEVPMVSISEFMGTVKCRTAIQVFKKFPHLKQRPYWGNHFWANGYCVDTVGLDEEMIRKYVDYQEQQERDRNHRKLEPGATWRAFFEGTLTAPLWDAFQSHVLWAWIKPPVY